MIENKFSSRLKKALSLKNMTQKDLRNKTGLGKSAVSQYVNGIITPKQDKLELLSEALGVSPAWLMGYDVPMYDMSAATQIPDWYSWQSITNDEMHNNAVELIDKLQEKYPNDKDVYMVTSILSTYMQHIDNISINNMITENAESVNKNDNDILKLYFDLNDDGKKLVADYLEMIHSKSEYICDNMVLSTGKDGHGFYFFCRNIDDVKNNDDE